MTKQSSRLKTLLVEQLVLAHEQDLKVSQKNTKGTGVDVPTTGTVLSSAYEQLRNAAEYAEEHLLLQRAIKRFFKLNMFLTKPKVETIGQDLIVELVQAGYLQNGRIGTKTVDSLQRIIKKYMAVYRQLREAGVSREQSREWMLAFVSVEAENLLNPHSRQRAIIFVAYQHFLQVIERDRFADMADFDSYELCLYIAVHQALLKSDADTVRHELFTLYGLSVEYIDGFKNYNQQIDKLYNSDLTGRLKRVVSRYGAPFRVLKSMIDDREDVVELLADKERFMEAYRVQVNHEYSQVERRLNRGLIKSIIFILITKVLIGLAIEVPYDLLLYGSVVVLPLAVNLLFPPIYMASLVLTVKLPSAANALTLYNYTESMLFGDDDLQIVVPRRRRQSIAMRLFYAIFFLIPVSLTILVLDKIGFNMVQMIIFFIFFSTASFLGFRLSGLVRELELKSPQTGFLASLRDSFYLPFILVGQWLSRKYSKVNIVGRFLDIAIELPLKALLRLIRQWIRFLNEKRDELY